MSTSSAVPVPIADLLATPAPFRAWLAGLPGETRLWQSGSPCSTCPVARFLQTNGWPGAWVGTETVQSIPESPRSLMPGWCQCFIRSFDVQRARTGCATAAGALAVLAEVAP